MAIAICLKCGQVKRTPWQACSACKYDPSGDDDALAKSVYLSEKRFDEPERAADYRERLMEYSKTLASGESVCFEQAELARLKRQYDMIKTVPLSSVYGALWRLFLPGLLFLIVLLVILLMVRALL